MNNLEIALMFKGLSHILANQEIILKQLGEENGNFYNLEDTNTLSVKFGQLAKKYQEKHNAPSDENELIYFGA